jgi:hypothetical protein
VLNFAKVSGPAWLEVSTNGGLSGTPANSDIGTNIFVVSLTDSNGVSASASLTIPVIADPPPAFIVNPFAETWADVGEPYSATIATNATDAELADGDILTFGKISGPAWLGVAPDGLLSGTPEDTNLGTNVFIVSVTNLGGASNTATMSLFVNGAPSFSVRNFTTPPATAGLAYSGTIATNVTDAYLGGGDSLSFFKVTGPAWLNVATNGALSGMPSSANTGTNYFELLVTDAGGLAATGNLTITVNAGSAGEIVAQISQQGTNLLLSWTGGSAPYQVKVTTDLSSGVWQDLGGTINVTNLILSPSNVSAYYQIQGQ